MTVPASEVVSSASDLLFAFVDDLLDLPHIRNPTAINSLWTLLKEQEQEPWVAQEDSGLQNLQKAVLNASRMATKWGNSRLRLLFEPSRFAKELSNSFLDIRESFEKLQGSPLTYQIAKQLDQVIVDLTHPDYLKLFVTETDFKKQFFDFLRENRWKSDISVGTWLAVQLRTDVDSIRQELLEIPENDGTCLEELILYVTELEESKCASDAGISSDTYSEEIVFRNPLDVVAKEGVKALGLFEMAWVLQGFADLIKCTKLPNGRLEVFEAGAIPAAINLAKAEKKDYIDESMTLLEALTFSGDAGEEGVYVDETKYIYLHISEHLDFLIMSMKDTKHPKARLLAAETVINMLVNSQVVWRTIRTQHDITSALVAVSNEETVDQSVHYQNQADQLCLLGLRHVTEYVSKRGKPEMAGDKTKTIVTALMKLLREGLSNDSLKNLAKDSLVALDTQVLPHKPTKEVISLVRSNLSELMLTKGFVYHSTFPGRMAIINMMTSLCMLDNEVITEGLFLYLLKMIKKTGKDLVNEPSDAGEDVTKLLSLSVKLLCFCVQYGKDTAKAVLTKNNEERKTLEEMLEEQDSRIPDESRLEILYILDQIDKENSQPSAAVGGIGVLLKMAKSPTAVCRAQGASRLLKLVERGNETERQELRDADGISVLMDLLKEDNEDCQKEAMLALSLLSESAEIAIPKMVLPFQFFLAFLHPKWPSNVRDSAVQLLDLKVNESEENALNFMETPEALKSILHCLDSDPENPSNQKCVSALLKMATEVRDASVRLGIANNGLGTLIRFVLNHATEERKEMNRRMLTKMLGMLCQSGNSYEEVVTKAGGHTFLLTSLEQNISKGDAAQGLLNLITDKRTSDKVLHAGFVTKAMGAIDREFASTEMALSLASICSTKYGIKQISDNPRSAGALLILLQHCPTLAGKGAAASVIAKTYDVLNSNADSNDQRKMEEACSHLIKYLNPNDNSQPKEFLKALAAFATGRNGRKWMHNERIHAPLIRYLTAKEIDTEVRDLVLRILAQMSSVFLGVVNKDLNYFQAMNAFVDLKIGNFLIPLPYLDEFKRNTESMKNVLTLVRNLSVAGTIACKHLAENHVVEMLLGVLKDHSNSLSTVTELAVRALVKFMDEPNGRKAYLNGGGIKLLVDVLKLDATNNRNLDVRSITPVILDFWEHFLVPQNEEQVLVVQDPKTCRAACDLIFSCDKHYILQTLTTIIYEGETSRIKWQAAVLMKVLATYGPTAKVCGVMVQAGSLDALSELRNDVHCQLVANDVLIFLRTIDTKCKKLIDAFTVKVK